ncbi:hypothetical protein QBC38DRAFT_404047 [Podospora fimiseda]|uniref:Uncharacterized protein n=1 Tax=Podospora fimiseda TaxID=252190 RepID=A0AAN6YKK6_9PEZI|nr:hypothetical protein QBC38DRAFT_404047 [Podospora fimiseda]
MSANILVSNGTCYSAAGDELDKSFIPCGNSAFGPQTCCGAGDICLKNNACFGYHGSGYGSALTYQAGCTDPEYKAQVCPDKHGIDGPWIALTLCDDGNGLWAPCSQEGSPTTLRPGSFCSCTAAASTTIVVSGSTNIPDVASLPQSTGGTISFFPGNTPTAPSNPPPVQTTSGGNNNDQSTSRSGGTGSTGGNSSPSETAGPGSSGSPSSPGQSPNQTGDPDPAGGGGSSGLNTGAKVGIAVGGVVGALVLLGVFIALYRKRRRGHGAGGIEGGKPGRSRTVHLPSPRASEADSNPVSEVEGKAARPWSMRTELEGSKPGEGAGLKKRNDVMPAELPGDGITMPHHDLSPVTELPGSERWAVEGGGRGRV